MAFIKESGNVVSFAEYQDVVDRDQRLFDANEGLNDDYLIDTHLKRATQRILTKIQGTSWWRESTGSTPTTAPVVNANRIIGRTNDFEDLCVYAAMEKYILPLIADFGSEDNSERQKMSFYQAEFNSLFEELIQAGDWYDFDGSGVITNDEVRTGICQRRRIR